MLERVKMTRGEVMHDIGALDDCIFFPEGGVISIVAEPEGALPTEVGMFGREGMSNLNAVLGSERNALKTLVQIDGHAAMRLDRHRFTARMEDSSDLRSVVLRYAQTMLMQVSYSAVSYAHFHMEARLARWLLMCCDRMNADEMHLTHEFMSAMIGAQRSSVTVTLHMLEGVGAIRSTRGLVTITDRAKLRELAGNAYGEPEAEYRRLIGAFGSADQPSA